MRCASFSRRPLRWVSGTTSSATSLQSSRNDSVRAIHTCSYHKVKRRWRDFLLYVGCMTEHHRLLYDACCGSFDGIKRIYLQISYLGTENCLSVFIQILMVTCISFDIVISPVNQSINVRFVGHCCTTYPEAPTVVSYKHNQKVHFWVVFGMYSYQSYSNCPLNWSVCRKSEMSKQEIKRLADDRISRSVVVRFV